MLSFSENENTFNINALCFEFDYTLWLIGLTINQSTRIWKGVSIQYSLRRSHDACRRPVLLWLGRSSATRLAVVMS